MAVDPVVFCEQRLPAIYDAARAALEAEVTRGDSAASARLSALSAAKVVTYVRFEGPAQQELWLLTDRAGIAVQRDAPAGDGFGYAVAMGTAAARAGIEMLDRGQLEASRLSRALLVMGSERARTLLSSGGCAFDVSVLNVPVLGTTTFRLAFGRTSLPERPDFHVSVEYDELEDAREQGTPPHQIFLAGKMRVDGDAAQAMRLAMLLAQVA